MPLRPYQLKCVESVFREWEKVASTMILMPTGTGKSVVFSEVVRRTAPKRSMIIADRAELIAQAARHVSRCGLDVQIEKAEKKAATDLFHKTPVVVASIQSLVSGKGDQKRVHRFDPHDFGLIVIDECDLACAPSYQTVLAHFRKNPALKIFGCTATSARGDGQALGRVFESCAFTYELADAIADGWLVPVETTSVLVKSLDFSKVRTTAGELNGADLSAILTNEEIPQGICDATLGVIGSRKAIMFTVSVAQAELYAEIFNRHRSGCAAWVSGETPECERALLIKDFSEGKIQIMVNVGVATRGFDVPSIECVVMARPTKSLTLFTQCLGRGTRPLAGTLDDLHSAYERREAIAASKKPLCHLLDFVGNSGRHKMVSVVDVLGGSYSEETKERARKKAEKKGGRVDQLLAESEEEVRARIEKERLRQEARKRHIVASADYVTRKVNLFDRSDRSPSLRMNLQPKPQFTEKQRNVLTKLGVNLNEIGYDQGRAIIAQYFERIEKGLATPNQVKLLKRHGYNTKKMTMKEASEKIDALAKNGWKRPSLKPA